KHNPTINWQTGLIVFNHCPLMCHQNSPHFEDPDETKEGTIRNEEVIKDGDRIWVMKWQEETKEEQRIQENKKRLDEEWYMELQRLKEFEKASEQGLNVSLNNFLPECYFVDFAPIFIL
ncbi:hypothetical protein BS17DRAFT_720783, partial [Gyrodon lividus]